LLSAANAVSYVNYGRVDALAAVTALGGSNPAPSPSPSTTTTTTFSGTLSKQHMSRSYSITTSGGSYSASLSFTRASNLTLTVEDATGAIVAQGSGPSVLQMSGSFPSAGAYAVVVSGTEGASFDLAVTYAS
jgi:hypothetical protein